MWYAVKLMAVMKSGKHKLCFNSISAGALNLFTPLLLILFQQLTFYTMSINIWILTLNSTYPSDNNNDFINTK